MIEAAGIVREVDDGRALVEVQRRTACGGCASQGGCGTSVIAAWFGRRPSRLWVRAATPVRVGEPVVIGLPEATLLHASLLMYLLPVLGLVGGATVGSLLTGTGAGSDLPGIAGGVLGLLAGLGASRARATDLTGRPGAEAAILRRERAVDAADLFKEPGPAGITTKGSV